MTMQSIYAHGEQRRIDYDVGASLSSSVSAGDVVAVGAALFGFATDDIPAYTIGSLAIDGVFDVIKLTSSDAIANGAVVYWHSTGLNTTSSGGTRIGVTVQSSSNGDTYARIWVNH